MFVIFLLIMLASCIIVFITSSAGASQSNMDHSPTECNRSTTLLCQANV
jgi:hypothetical protein